MKNIKRMVVINKEQFVTARISSKFSADDSHRPFVEFMFDKIHKCKVTDHTKLRYTYGKDQNLVITITGEIGISLATGN